MILQSPANSVIKEVESTGERSCSSPCQEDAQLVKCDRVKTRVISIGYEKKGVDLSGETGLC